MYKKTKLCIVTGIVALAVLGAALGYRYAYADAYSDCMSTSDAPVSLASASVCGPCRDYLGYHASWSLAWISPTDDTRSNVITASSTDSTASATLRYREYTCDHPVNWSGPSPYAYYVWIGAKGSNINPGSALNWISPSYISQLYVGGATVAFAWNTAGNQNITISMPDFMAYVEAGNPGTSITDLGSDTKRYVAEVSINQCNDNHGISGYVHGTHSRASGGIFTCEGWPSTITVDINGGTPTPTTATSNGEFKSKSTVIALNNNIADGADSSGRHSETSGEDGSVEVFFSIDADQDSATVEFKHEILYENTGNFSLTKSGSETDDAKIIGATGTATTGNDPTPAITTVPTGWSVSGTDTKTQVTSYTDSGTTSLSPTATSTQSATASSGSKTQATVYLNEGETKTVCSRITYTSKNMSFNGTEHETQAATTGSPAEDGYEDIDTGAKISADEYNALSPADQRNYTPYHKDAVAGSTKQYHMDYTYSGSNSGYSEACATVTRAKNPDPSNPAVVGNTSADITFAGETAPIVWSVSATGVPTRRLAQRQFTAYLVSVAVPSSSGAYYTGTNRSGSSPYDFFNIANVTSRFIYTNGDEGSVSWATSDSKYDSDFTDSKTTQDTFKVPNEVGNKICASAGYQFEYWWGVAKDGGSTVWAKDSKNPYWRVFDGSCRTIAKKPTAAVWNGGIFTSGGISASVANRFNHIAFGDTASAAPADTTVFGSWSEALTVAGGKIRSNTSSTEFASGSVLYAGTSKSLTPPNVSNSLYPLTIANSALSDPGHSGIIQNSTLRTRLGAYLGNRASGIGNTIAGLSNATGTQIYSVSGSLDITGDITTSPGPYASIYDIPQVIIFVSGDVNISSDVTRIDAWIIATGEVNTCSEFNAGGAGTTTSDSGLWPYWGNNCANQLIFNGPVMASSLKLNRSFGSAPHLSRYGAAPTNGTTESSREAPAEIFNLRADTYLWAYAQSTRYHSSFTESYSRELAPRY